MRAIVHFVFVYMMCYLYCSVVFVVFVVFGLLCVLLLLDCCCLCVQGPTKHYEGLSLAPLLKNFSKW